MATPTELIQQLYVAYYNRPADVAGLAFWVNAYNNGTSIDTISKNFNNAAEYTNAYAGKSADAIVNTVYQNLFGRTADSVGLDFWGKKIAAKEITVADLVKFITAGALNADGTPNADGAVFNNKVAAAVAFTTEIGTAGNEAERVAYSSGTSDVLTAAKAYIAGVTTDDTLATAVANVHATAQKLLPVPDTATPKSFTLTAGVDTGAAFLGGAGDDTYNATGATLTALDSIDGGTGNNTLSIQDPSSLMATTLPAGVSLKNIQTITINTAGSLGQVTSAGSAAVAAVKQVLTITPTVVTAGSANTITVTYGGVSVTTAAMDGTVTEAEVSALVTSAINAIAGSTVATTVGNQVVVTAPVAGTALPTITTVVNTAAGDVTWVQATPQANVVGSAAVAATSAAVYDVSGVDSLTTLAVNSIGNDNVKAAATTDVTLTNTANTNTTTVVGGKAVTITENGTAGTITVDGTAGALVINQNTAGAVTVGGTTAVTGSVTVNAKAQGATAIAIDGGTTVNVTTAGVSTGTITIGNTTKPTGAIAVDSTSAYSTSTAGNFTLGNVVVKGGTTVNVTQHAASAAAKTAAAADTSNFTVTQAAVAVTGSANTTAVTVTNDAIATVHNQSDAVAVATESASVTFTALTSGQSVTVNGLTFTAGAAGTTIAQTAAAFANLTAGALQGNSTLGVYTGAFSTSAFVSGAVSGATSNTVVFTGASAGAVTDIVVGGVGAAATTTAQGVDAVDAVVGNAGVVANTISISDVNAGSATALGKITSATLSNFTTATIADTALSTLNVTGGSGNIIIDNSGLTTPTVKTLNLNVNAQTGGTLDDADIYTTLNITTSGTKNSTLANITFGGTTALNVSGTKGLTLTSAAGLTSLATVTVSGAAGLTANVGGLTTVTDVNASASSGTNTITLDATKATYEGGSGVDNVTTSAVAPTKAITLGAGNDKLTLASGTTSVTGLINGGDGTDTLVMVAADAVTASANSLFSTKVTNFETLQLTGGTGAQLVHVDTLGGYNSAIVSGEADGGVLTLDGFTSGGTLTISGSIAGTTGAYAVSSSAFTTPTTDSFNIALSSAAGITAGTVTANKVESLVISSTDTDTTAANSNTLTVAGDTATSITVSGNAALSLTSTAALVTTVNASTMTAGFTYTTSGTAAQTVTGSATAANNLTAGGANSDRLIGGSGNDTLTANGAADTLTGGAGRDKFIVATASSNVNVYSTITDASSGDSIQLANNGTETFTTTKLSLGDTATFQNYVDLAAAGTGAVNAAIKWFQFAGNTYIVEDLSAGSTFAPSTDIVVKLTGLVDLSTASLSVAGPGGAPVLLIG